MKLKEIPINTVVHTPTEAEAKELLAILHENGYKWCHGKDLSDISIMAGKEAVGINFDGTRKNTIINFWYIETARRKRFTILTLAEFKERHVVNEENFAKSEEEKPQPKFKMRDRVKEVGYQESCIAMMRTHVGEVGTIIQASGADENFYQITCDNGLFSWHEDWLEPYPEPETKPTEDMETKENHDLSQKSAEKCYNGDAISNDENKELNLCELIGDRGGIHVYCPTCGEVTLQAWDRGKNTKPLIFAQTDTSIIVRTFANGKAYVGGECVIFPSRALYEQHPLDPLKAWSVWQEEHKYHIEVTVNNHNNDGDLTGSAYVSGDIAFRTSSDRDKCIEEIQAIIEKYCKK